MPNFDPNTYGMEEEKFVPTNNEYSADDYFDPDTYGSDLPAQQEEFKPTSKVESLLRGGVQGLSYEFADEVTAEAISRLTGRPYEEVVKEERSKYKTAESP